MSQMIQGQKFGQFCIETHRFVVKVFRIDRRTGDRALIDTHHHKVSAIAQVLCRRKREVARLAEDLERAEYDVRLLKHLWEKEQEEAGLS